VHSDRGAQDEAMNEVRGSERAERTLEKAARPYATNLLPRKRFVYGECSGSNCDGRSYSRNGTSWGEGANRNSAARIVLESKQFLERIPVLIELAPSILSADFARLGEQAQAAVSGGATLLHVDVMDGHFVPNLTIGPAVVKSLRQVVDVPLDVHLMIENPDQYIPAFADAGADWISVHQEACRHLNRTLELIRSHNVLAGVVINPATPVQTLGEVLDIVDYVLVMSVNPGFGGQKFIPSALEKMRKLVTMRNAKGANFRIEIDGGIAPETIGDAVRYGAEVLVAGNAVFGKGDPATNVRELLKLATSATMQQV
jgi:ribulose-phosphate 3-epimerase